MLNTRIDLPLPGHTAKEPLGLVPYADALSGFVKTCETPLTVGIQGDWGIGKTSLLNLVRHRLETPDTRVDKREYPTIYFNTWQYAQLDGERHLTVALLGDLVRRIGALDQAPETVQDQARGLLRKVGRMAASAGSQVLENKLGVSAERTWEAGAEGADDDGLPDVLRQLQLVVEYKAEFRRLVAELLRGKEPGSRLVVMIDDLDRIRPARALDLLASVKNFLDVPGCVFLLAVDYEVIQRGVAETMGAAERKRLGKSYFDKIIQVPFNMPVASYEVGKYVMALLGWTSSNEKERYVKVDGADGELWFKYQQTVAWDVARDLENLTTLTVGRNPRAIKRAANYFALLKRVFDANGGQDAAKDRGGAWQDRTLRLLYGMACFQLAYPELFTLFVQEPTPTGLRRMEDIDYLGTLPQMRTIGERVSDVDETMSQVAGFFDQVVSVVDENGDGDISAGEFGAVLDVLKYARLTNAKIEGAEDGFAKIRERVLHYAAGWSEADRAGLARSVDAFERSDWNDALRLRIREAGARFFNLTWEGRLLGSVASAQKAPLQFYLKDPGGLLDRLPEHVAPFVEEVGHGHYGVGSLGVDLPGIVASSDSQGVLRDLLRGGYDGRRPDGGDPGDEATVCRVSRAQRSPDG